MNLDEITRKRRRLGPLLGPDLRNLRDASGQYVYRGAAWKARRERLLERAGHKCENCGKPNHETVETVTGCGFMVWRAAPSILPHARPSKWRDPSGRVICFPRIFKIGAQRPWPGRMLLGEEWPPPRREIRVVLQMAHLTRNPLRTKDAKLAMLCQWCHLNYDKMHHNYYPRPPHPRPPAEPR